MSYISFLLKQTTFYIDNRKYWSFFEALSLHMKGMYVDLTLLPLEVLIWIFFPWNTSCVWICAQLMLSATVTDGTRASDPVTASCCTLFLTCPQPLLYVAWLGPGFNAVSTLMCVRVVVCGLGNAVSAPGPYFCLSGPQLHCVVSRVEIHRPEHSYFSGQPCH